MGELDLSTCDALDDAILVAVRRAPIGLELDLCAVSFLDSTGLHSVLSGCLVAEQATIPTAVLVAAGSPVFRLLEMTAALERLNVRVSAGPAAPVTRLSEHASSRVAEPDVVVHKHAGGDSQAR